ncbi:MAG: glycosyltransferase [Phycisphaerales bacterium JB037]
MHIVVVSELEIGSRRAHAINVIKTAGGFARLGHRVTLLCRSGEGEVSAYLHELGEEGLEVELWDGPAGTAGGSRAMGDWACARALALGADAVYARHFAAAVACSRAGLATTLETHAYVGDANPMLVEAVRATRGGRGRSLRSIVTISDRLADWYAQLGADASRIGVIPDGVDVERFARPGTLEVADPLREGREDGRPIAVYSGHLYDYKGVPTVLDAAALASDWDFALVGGMPEDIERTRARVTERALANVRVIGWVPHREVPGYLWHADALLLPPSAREASKDWTSPVKLGEYLASGRPIVASAIPALRDWLGDDEAIWFTPDDAASLVEGLSLVRTMPGSVRESLRMQGQSRAREFAYARRAERILRSLGESRTLAA